MSGDPELTPDELRRRLAGTDRTPRRRAAFRTAPLRVVAAVVLPLCAVVAGIVVVLSSAPSETPAAAASSSVPPGTPRSTPTTFRMTTTTVACRMTLPGPSADVDGDGCPDQLEVADGVVRTPRGRYAIGQPGDRIAVGDWDCDGISTPALLRPTTGEVWTFSSWPEGDGIPGQPAGTATDATDIVGLDVDGDGCDDLTIVTPGGRRLLRRGAPR